jgi:hypothetical protein
MSERIDVEMERLFLRLVACIAIILIEELLHIEGDL